MTLDDFKRSLTRSKPPAKLAAALTALWWAAKDDWARAHELVMDQGGRDCAWVHAYLHRVEGDLDNARYWYGQARRPVARGALQAEWDAIAAEILTKG
jgi:hypothetical protein